MVRLYSSILILLFSEFLIGSVLASKSSVKISAIIQSYADAFTTVVPDKTQHVTTQIYPSIEVQHREYVHDLTSKANNDNKPAFSSVPLDVADSILKSTNSEEFLSPSAGASIESKESKESADRAISFSEHDASNEHARFKDSSVSEESNESYEPKGPAYHVIPFSEHENPREPSTRPNYTAPGAWARPPPDKNIPLDFLPTKLLAQVRDSHTIKHVPREYAMESAETSEEKENAARLKEVLKESKANTIYTEEGYEDAAYDHAGHIRDADFQEDFARQLNEELERNKSYSGEAKRPKIIKNHKPRKYRDDSHGNFSQNNKKALKIAKGARKSKQKISPKHYRLLKNALNQPIINPKLAVERGIVELEKDLKNEYREGQRTSTEPYAYTTTETPTTFKPPVTESVFQSKMDFETTTMRHNIFTIRPKKTFVRITPKPHRDKPKKILKAFSVSPNINNYNAYTSSYNYEPTQLPGAVDYGELVWGHIRQNQNSTPTITYPPSHFEQQSINPLAVATVNGHGPYLVVETAPQEALTPSPSESQNLASTIGYGAVNDYNITQPIVVDSNVHHNANIQMNRKANRVTYNSEPHAVHIDTDVDKPVSYKRDEIRHRGKNPTSKKLKSQSTPEGNTNYIEGDRDSYMEYYTALQSLKTPNIPIAYSNYKPNANWFNQWPNIYDTAKPVEGYGSDGVERPPNESKNLRGISLVTRLLAPAPLSASEYATFQRQNREIKPITSTVIEMMPIIDVIHKHEHEQNSFSFLFRRKRSTFGFFRSPNFKLREQVDRKSDENKNLNQNSSNSSNIKYPVNFQSLLNESPNVATKEVDAEIKWHFKNDKAISDKTLSQSPKELTLDNRTSSNNKEDFKRGEIVEVQVPELDITSVFERDESEPTTQEPRVDTKKYPFYTDSSVLRNTALKYIVNPKEVPKKTLGGMEFYDSRVLECEEVNPNLERIIPKDEEIANKRGPQKKKSILRGLGDKIDCYKAKYFDKTPFDNPLFIEKGVEIPPPPIELNPKQFAARILELPAEKEEYTIPKGPKNPEFLNIKRIEKVKRPSRYHVSEQNIRQHLHPKLKKPNLVNTNIQRYRYPPKNPTIIDSRMKPPDVRSKMKIKATNLKVVPRYQHLVYEDVMGNIMNLDKSHKSHVPKRAVTSLYFKHYKRDNNREQGISGSQNLKTVTIDGLVPPPQKLADKLVNNKHRYKRSASLKDYQHMSPEETNNTENATLRIVFTTPIPRNTLSGKQIHNADILNATAAQKIHHTSNHSTKHPNRSEADSGRYGKFSTSEKINSSIVTRRKEPKYNVAKTISSPNKTSITYEDSTFESSTFIPVMVNLYRNFTSRIPRGSKNNQAKKQVAEEFDHDKHSDKREKLDDKFDSTNEQEEDPKKQFVIFDPVQGKDKNKSNDVAVTSSIPSIEDHKELVEFLKGNPPGYDEAFTEEDDFTDDKKKELYKVKDENSDVEGLPLPKNKESHKENLETQELSDNEENDDENPETETEDAESDERKKEVSAEETATDDSSEEAEENVKSDDDEEKSQNDDVQEDKPFVRFSSRPESPPESFEDERYADLGPRINKPYFYHPPFDVPTYEKYALGKSIQDHDGDEYGHEETEYHKKYVFPWAHNDEKDDSKEESEHFSALDRHEYPWEKRERQEKERQKREKMHKKYGKKNVNPNNDKDSYSKPSNIDLVYTSSKNDYRRGKKDVNSLQSDPENHSSIFSSKYTLAKIKGLKADEQNKDDIDKSNVKYVKNLDISTSKDEGIYTIPRKNIKDFVSENITSDTMNKNINASIVDTNTQKPLTTLSSSKVESAGKIMPRSRGRTRRTNTNNNKHNETTSSDINSVPKVQPILSSRITRQRGRNRSNATILTTTTTAKPNVRKRSRQASTTTIRTTPKSVNEKRRRAFRITSYAGSNTESTTPPTLPTSTGRTVEREHRSRVSKEMIITQTVEDNDGDDQNEDSDKNISSRDNNKSTSKVGKTRHSKNIHRQQTKNMPYNENATKKERVEKVTITMEETPDHVYETKEIDKDGIKGKFITITANNNSDIAEPTKHNHDHTPAVDDAEMEEIQRRMEAFKSFDSVIQDTENLGDEPSSLRTAEKYLIGSLLQKLPLPLSRKLTGEKENNKTENNDNENEDDNEDEDQSEEYDNSYGNDQEIDENGDEGTDSEDLNDKKGNGEISRSNNTETIEQNPFIIKDPNNRNYYYVETP